MKLKRPHFKPSWLEIEFDRQQLADAEKRLITVKDEHRNDNQRLQILLEEARRQRDSARTQVSEARDERDKAKADIDNVDERLTDCNVKLQTAEADANYWRELADDHYKSFHEEHLELEKFGAALTEAQRLVQFVKVYHAKMANGDCCVCESEMWPCATYKALDVPKWIATD